ncbi:MAG: glycosyltransferase [Methylovulum sp.]|nr:glycosyltransferase [Methylovulum sp.]
MSHRIAYLVSQYPAYSHTFILREVQQLRQLGLAIAVASINPPDRPLAKLTDTERTEAEQTFYVKAEGPVKALVAVGKTLFTRPLGLWRGVRHARRLGGWDIKRLLYHVFYLAEAVLIGQWLHSQQIRHLHVHFATPAASVGMLVKTVFDTGFSFTVHGPDEFYDAAGYNLPEKILAADFIFCISHYARSQVMKLSPVQAWPKLEVCRLGVDPQRFAPAPKIKVNCQCELLCVGRLTSAKGQAILLEAIAQLQNEQLPVRLTLVGMGPDEKSLQAYAEQLAISGQIRFTGAIDQDHILAYYQSADIFVLPSFAEGLPVVLMEAMAMEIPCITTAITGIPELIHNDEDGVLVAASDVAGLAEAIKHLANDPERRRRIGQAGRRKVLAEYDLHDNTRHLFMAFTRRLETV